jgi:hypothetical protein
MPHRIFFSKLIQMRVQFFRCEMKVIVQKSAQVGRSVRRVRDHFHAVAGGDDHALFDSGLAREIAAGIGQSRVRDRQAFAHFKRCALVIHANKLVSHEAVNLWIAEK